MSEEESLILPELNNQGEYKIISNVLITRKLFRF